MELYLSPSTYHIFFVPITNAIGVLSLLIFNHSHTQKAFKTKVIYEEIRAKLELLKYGH